MIPALAPLSIDYYKADHIHQYPTLSEEVYSNFTPRSAHYFKGSKFYDNKVVVFGLQIFIKDYLIREWNETFFNLSKDQAVSAYKHFMDNTLGKDKITTKHIEDLHDLGYLPIRIKALKEGTRCPISVPPYTIVNTHPDYFWLTNYLESVMSSECWKPMTYATIAYEYRRVFNHYAELTGASQFLTKFQAHDFSFRGASCREESMKSGIGFLTSSVGTDSCLSIVGAQKWYNADISKELIGTSVFATEHSTMTSNIEYFKRMLDTKSCINLPNFKVSLEELQFDETHTDTQRLAEIAYIKYLITVVYPTGIVSIVSDSFDFWYMIEYGLEVLKPFIENRQPDSLGLCKVVIRPDSGDPIDIISGNPRSRITIEQQGAISALYNIFGYTVNKKGFKQLNPKIGLIYGDSITLERQEAILSRLAAKKFATDCIVLGVGSYSLCMNSRDTFGFAMKSTHIIVDNESFDIYKAPKTDSGTKQSARGYLSVIEYSDGYKLIQNCSKKQEMSSKNELKTIFLNGKLTLETSLQEIRQTLHGDSF